MRPTSLRKILAHGLALLLAFASFLHAADPPRLSLSQAAVVAENFLKGLNLGPDYFIRAITLSGDAYEARFEPTQVHRVRVGEEAPPILIKLIIVGMDGTVRLEEREISHNRSIIRSKVPEQAGAP